MEEKWFSGLPTKIIGRYVRCFKKATSTNDLAWLEVSRGAPEGTIIFADEQTKGRGRFGRSWFSPVGGLWTSIILKPQIPPEHGCLLMAIGAIAVCELIRDKFNLSAHIRWPNDVILNNKKVAGIIVEAKYLANKPEAMVLGIGFNVNIPKDKIPEELKDTFTSLSIEKNKEVDFRLLAGDFISYLDKWYQYMVQGQYETINSAWKEMSAVMDKQVIIKMQGKEWLGKVSDLDPCKGISLTLDSGEVKVFQGEYVESLRIK